MGLPCSPIGTTLRVSSGCNHCELMYLWPNRAFQKRPNRRDELGMSWQRQHNTAAASTGSWAEPKNVCCAYHCLCELRASELASTWALPYGSAPPHGLPVQGFRAAWV